MNRVRGQVVLVVTDTFLAFSLEMLKLHLNILVNNEFALNFASYFIISPFYLYGAALVSLIAAGIADSLFCKFFPIVVGLAAGLMSLSCAAVQLWINTSSNFLNTLLELLAKVGLFVYIATSGIRDIFIIEQIKFPNPYIIHRFIFFLVYTRIIVKGACRIAFEQMSLSVVKFTLTAAFAVFVAYFIVFTFGLIVYFYIEPMYLNMWSHSLSCFFRSLKGKREGGKKEKDVDSSFRRLAKTSVDTYHMNLHEPEVTRKCLGFKAITKENPTRNEVVEKTPTPPPQEKKEEKGGYFSMKGWLHTIVAPEKKPDEAAEAAITPKEVKDGKDQMVYGSHWLQKSAPKSTEYVIIQTARFIEVFSMIVAGSFLSWLDYFVSALSYLQTFISTRNVDSIFDSIDIHHVSFGFDLVTFPIFYFLLFPLLCTSFKRDVRFFYLGYLLVFLANIIMLCVQAKAVVGQKYVPGPSAGQIRIYNGLNSNISIISSWDQNTNQIAPHGELVIMDIHLDSNFSEREVQIKSELPADELTSNVMILEAATTSYVVGLNVDNKKIVFVRVGSKDLTAFGKQCESLVMYRVISAFTTNFDKIELVFSDRRDDNTGKTVYQRLSETGKIHGIEPGEYNVLVRIGTSSEYGYPLTRPANMQKWGVYSLFFYVGSNGKTIEAQHFHLEGPPGIRYTTLYFHLLLASIGRAFATVPFYMFLYSESPEKLRATVISMVLFLNLMWLAVFNSRFVQETSHGKHMTFMILFVFVHGVLFLIIAFTSRYRHRHSGY